MEYKLSVKSTDRMRLKESGIDEVGNHKTIILVQTNSTLSDFE